MKTRWAMTLTIASIALGLFFWQFHSVSPAVASETAAVSAVAAALPALGDEGAKYVGSKKCKMCHKDHYKSWETMKKFKTFELLLPGNATESKTKHNLDPNKDYSKDESCLTCHATGFGHKGGYFIPDPADEKAVKKAKKLANVGCESCHGPGGEYVKLHKQIKKEKRTYKVEEMYAAGLFKIEESRCIICHNDKSPTYDTANPFDFAKVKDKGGHAQFPLAQREE